jgi:hypothetical protein
MPLVAALLLLIAQTGGPNTADLSRENSAGFRPVGSPAELYDLGLLARLREPGVAAHAFSSYDRTGGNNDGFNGTYSKLRLEGGNSVLAEATGPGVVQRIWFTHTSGKHPGLLGGKKEHLKIYLDGRDTPALDVPLEIVFSGAHPHFPRPLAFEGSGGYVSYVPIPFRAGCKILVEGQAVRFYQINLVGLPGAEGVTSFTDETAPDDQAKLDRAARLWTRPGAYEESDLTEAYVARYEVEGLAHSSHKYALRAGPSTVRSLEVFPAAGTEDAWREARLRLVWDDDEAAEADSGVDLPLGLAFGLVEGGRPYQSLLLGRRADSWYNRFPMPYHRQAILRIDSDKPLRGTLQVRTVRGTAADAGFFRAALREARPARPKVDVEWLNEKGRGHFAGVLLMTEGKSKLPFWLEGDDRFTVDGRLAIHGTGTEDYFNCGWYALPGRLDGPACYPLHGFPAYGHQGETWRVAAYRWHLSDPVPYSRSIVAGIEHGGENNVLADYRAAVFWYSERPSAQRGSR